jgi:general secretion pathway protein I
MKSSGFTLIECLVALFIIAIVLASSTRAIGLSVEDVREVYIRQVANWAVENQANQYLMDRVYPDMGQTKKNIVLGGINFIIQSSVSATPNPFFRKIEISVAEQKRPNHTIFKTVNFISQY